MRFTTTATLATLATASLALAACSSDDDVVTVTSTTTVPSDTATAEAAASATSSAPSLSAAAPNPEEAKADAPAAGDLQAQLQQAIDKAVAAHGGSAAVSIADANGVTTAGTDQAMPTWSTIKVPISIAALRNDPSQIGPATSAITQSDNAAAQTLWASLGSPDQAAAVTSGVLGEGGVSVQVNSAPVRPEFSTFGQTQMTTSQQAQFAANLPAIAGAEQVLNFMGQVDPSQKYGLGQLPGAQIKGGWGPNLEGKYDVRQLGVISTPNGSKGLAITVSPASGTYEEAQAMANQIVSEISPAVTG